MSNKLNLTSRPDISEISPEPKHMDAGQSARSITIVNIEFNLFIMVVGSEA